MIDSLELLIVKAHVEAVKEVTVGKLSSTDNPGNHTLQRVYVGTDKEQDGVAGVTLAPAQT